MNTSIATDFAAIAARMKSVSLPDSDDAAGLPRLWCLAPTAQ